jgi:hypothetical protein
MPITFAQAAVNTLNDVDFQVIDNLRRYSWLWDQIVWDDSVTPGTAGATLTYGYTRLITPAAAGFRALNSEYTPGQAVRTRFTVDLKPMGGAFNVDRVLANLGPAQTNEVMFQLSQLTTSAIVRLQQEIILGDTAVDANGFDGLSKSLTGTVTEKTAGYTLAGNSDWSPGTVISQVIANQRLDELDDFLSLIVPSHVGSGDMGAPGALPPGVRAILGNTKSIARIKSVARWSASYTEVKDDLGRQISAYGPWTLIDIGDRSDGSAPIIPITSTNTDIYAVTFGLDAFHGVSPSGTPIVQTWLPNFQIAGAVKTGELEIGPVAMTLKNTKAAGVYRTMKVQ